MAKAIDIGLFMTFLAASIVLVGSLNIFSTEMQTMNETTEMSDTAVIMNVTEDTSHDPLGVGLFGQVIFSINYLKDTLFRTVFIESFLNEVGIPPGIIAVIGLGIGVVVGFFLIQFITNRYFSGVE